MTAVQKGQTFELHESDVTAIATPVTLAGLPTDLPHCFVGVQFFDDAGGTSVVVPGAGTAAIEIVTINNTPVLEAINGSPMDATAAVTLNWDGNTLSVKVTLAAITVATHYKVVVTANKS